MAMPRKPTHIDSRRASDAKRTFTHVVEAGKTVQGRFVWRKVPGGNAFIAQLPKNHGMSEVALNHHATQAGLIQHDQHQFPERLWYKKKEKP